MQRDRIERPNNKVPTLTVASFVFLFFRQTTELTLYVPLFSTVVNWFSGNPEVARSEPCFSQELFRAFAKPGETKGSPLSIFFGFERIF